MAASSSHTTTIQYPIWISCEKYCHFDELSAGPLYYIIQSGGTHIIFYHNFNEDDNNVSDKDQREDTAAQ